MKEKKVVYPISIDPEQYSKLKEYAKNHGKQSVGSVIRYAIMVFLNKYK